MSAPEEWFRDWFGEAYLSLYPHRDEDEARHGVSLYLEEAELAPGARVLDLACGAGRHLERLREAGLDGVGIDLSATLLREAAGRGGPEGSLVRADMRALPFDAGAFDGLVNFFTSFGYFQTPEEDDRVLREIRRVLRPGAPFLIDYMNVPWVVERLDPETVGRIRGRPVRQTRWVEGGHVFKRIEIGGAEDDEPQVFHERVRLYPPEDLVALLERRDLVPHARFGGYRGQPFDAEAPRLVLVGRAR